MSRFDTQLSDLTQAEIIARLDGQGGLLALSNRELFFISDQVKQSARLSQVKRISVNKQSGNVDVSGEQGVLMEVPPSAFQKDELKLFLEALKGHVLRAKSDPTLRTGTSVISAAPAAPRNPTVHPAPEPETPPITPATDEETVAPAAAVAAAPAAVEPASKQPTQTPEPQPRIPEPPKTLPDEPSDALWAYEGSPKPAASGPAVSSPVTPVPAPVLANPSQDDVSLPPAPSAAPVRPAAPSAVSGLLKVWAFVTLLFAVAYMGLNLTDQTAAVDPLISVGVLIGGVALALIQWRLSEPR